MKRVNLLAVGALAGMCASTLMTGPAWAAPTPWTQQVGTSRTEGVGGVAVSSCGNVYVGGTTSGAFAGRKNAGQADAFLVKFDKSGTQKWVREFGTKGIEYVAGVAVSPCGGAIYVAGYTDGTFPKRTNAGGIDGFLAKYSSGGAQLWVREFGTPGDDLVRGVAVSPAGNVYVVGSTDGEFAPLAGQGGTDAFVLKFNSSGTQKWVQQLGTTDDDTLAGVTVSKTGEIYATGDTKGAFSSFVSEGGVDAIALKLSTAGVVQWLEQFGTTGDDHALGTAISKLGELYLAGYTTGAFTSFVNAGAADAWLAQYDSASGGQNWLEQFGTDAEDHLAGVAVTKTGLVYTAGLTYGSFAPFVNAGDSDGFFAVHDATGAALALGQFGTSAEENAAGVAVAKSGDVVVAGGTKGSLPGFLNAGNADAYAIDFALV